MYKRRDWLLTRGADGGGEETSSSSSEGSEPLSGEGPLTSSEESSESDEEHPSSSDGDSIPSQFARLEDISENDLSGSEDEISGDDEDGAHAEELKIELKNQLQRWMKTLEDGSIHSKGKPLRCLACGGSLLLNSRTFQQHLNSKKHKKTSDSWNKDDVFEFASGKNNKKMAVEDAETHEERFMRAKATAEKNVLEQKNRLKCPRKGGPRKRPGKRQRRALKET